MATHHSTGSKQLFQIGIVIIPTIKSIDKAISFPFQHFTPRRGLSNGLLSDPNKDRMQNLCPSEVGLPIYHFGVNKIVGVSSSRVVLGFFCFHALC